jgi:alpha-beta hydrolase superfamily lysophospholipase
MTSSSTKGLKIIVLAHSLGGMVARTAAVLSNHPKCVVSDIVMLGSPNNKYYL